MARIGRRRFLGWAAAGAVAAGGVVAAIRTSGYDVPERVAEKLLVLSPWQWVVVGAVGRRLLAPESADVAHFADSYLLNVAESDRTDLLRFVAYVEHVAPLGAGHLSRFSELSAEAQDAVLERLEASDVQLLRAGFQALKALAMMALYSRAASWKAIGYGGPVVKWDTK